MRKWAALVRSRPCCNKMQRDVMNDPVDCRVWVDLSTTLLLRPDWMVPRGIVMLAERHTENDLTIPQRQLHVSFDREMRSAGTQLLRVSRVDRVAGWSVSGCI